MFKKELLASVFLLILCGCQPKPQVKVSPDYVTISSPGYVRYVFVKGHKDSFSLTTALTEFGELSKRGETYTYTFDCAQFGEWQLLKFPQELANEHYTFHNLVYWFLGSGPEDPNAAIPLGVSISRNETDYIVFNDYELRDRLASKTPFSVEKLELSLDDSLLGAFSTGDRFVLNIPFETFTPINEQETPGYHEYLESFAIDLSKLKSDELKWKQISITFNQRVHNKEGLEGRQAPPNQP